MVVVQIIHLVQLCVLSGPVESQFEAAADDIKTEANEPVKHPCGGEYAPDYTTQSHQELPERHMLLADHHHQRAGVVLDEDAGNTVTARGVVYHPFSLSHRELVCVCGYLVCV